MKLDDLQCRHVVDVLTDYLEGVLPAEHRVVLEQHLLFCEGCATYVEQLRTSVDLTGRLLQTEVPAAVMDRLLRTFSQR
jgi:anti-sigma factor RsiW